MDLLQLFYEMLRIRRVEEHIADQYSKQEMRCPTHLSIGQEAIAVGVCKAALRSDYLVSNHRAHAHYLAKGGSLQKMIAEIYGKETGCSNGYGGSMHLIDLDQGILGTTPIVGGTIPIGVGAAFHCFLNQENPITIIFFGEGATEEGVWMECLNFASLKSLPVLFVCEHNFYSVYSPMNVRQSPQRSRVEIAKAHGIVSFQKDGNDVEQVYELACHCMDHIRNQKEPCFVEFTTYRHREHCGPNFDTDLNYRSEKEVKDWFEKCPIQSSIQKLFEKKRLNQQQLQEFESSIQKEIEEAFAFAKASSFPTYER